MVCDRVSFSVRQDVNVFNNFLRLFSVGLVGFVLGFGLLCMFHLSPVSVCFLCFFTCNFALVTSVLSNLEVLFAFSAASLLKHNHISVRCMNDRSSCALVSLRESVKSSCGQVVCLQAVITCSCLFWLLPYIVIRAFCVHCEVPICL
jgi:hypothetical protein